jgi:hypothetical protein
VSGRTPPRRAVAIAITSLPIPLIAAFALASGCGETRSGPSVVMLSPRPGDGPLALNRSLTIVFDEPIDPSSVTEDSVSVAHGDGRKAAGTLLAEGDRVTFTPKPVASATLDDGGYPPGGRVVLALAGFPSRLAVRGAGGEPLAAPLRAEYDVRGEDPAGGEPPFVDPVPGVGPALLDLAAIAQEGELWVAPGGEIVLRFSEPLDPRRVNATSVELRYENLEPVDVVLALEQGATGASLAIRPRGGFQRDTRYLLVLVAGGLRDLASNPLDDVHPIHVRCDEQGPRDAGMVPRGGDR